MKLFLMRGALSPYVPLASVCKNHLYFYTSNLCHFYRNMGEIYIFKRWQACQEGQSTVLRGTENHTLANLIFLHGEEKMACLY